MPKNVLKLEGIMLFLLSLYGYYLIHGSWILFIVLFFIPDISMIGYLKDKKIGAVIYNAIHNYIVAILFLFVGSFTGSNLLIQFGIVLFAHVSLDRGLGFGLKYHSNFKDTHMQRV